MPEHTFNTTEPLTVYVENQRGRVTLRAEATDRTVVRVTGDGAEQAAVTLDGDRLQVIAPRERGFFSSGRGLEIDLVVPVSSRLSAKLGSSDLIASGELERLDARTGSGDIDVAHVSGPAMIESGSGDVAVQRAEAPVKVKSGSGDVRIDAAAELAVTTGSGDLRVGTSTASVVVKTGSGSIEIDDATGDLRCTTGSGDVEVHTLRAGHLVSRTASGDVRLGILAGIPTWTDISTSSGRLRSSLESLGQPEPGAPHVELHVTTSSGDVTLTPA